MLKHESSLREVQRISNYYNNIIKSNYGKIIDIEYWGLKTLSYQIKKNKKAHYILIKAILNDYIIQKILLILRISENIIRFLFIKTKNFNN